MWSVWDELLKGRRDNWTGTIKKVIMGKERDVQQAI